MGGGGIKHTVVQSCGLLRSVGGGWEKDQKEVYLIVGGSQTKCHNMKA